MYCKKQKNIVKYKQTFERRKERIMDDILKGLNDKQYENAIKNFKEITENDASGYFGLALSYDGLKNPQETIKNIDLFLENMQNCKPEPCKYDKWSMKQLYNMRAKANFKLHRYSEWIKDIKKSKL